MREVSPQSPEARRKRLALCHKKNILTHAGQLWQDVVDEVGGRYPDVERDYVHVDAMCQHLPLDPGRLRSIAVIGPAAVRIQAGAAGSPAVQPSYLVTPLDGIRERVGTAVAVNVGLLSIVHLPCLGHVNRRRSM